METPTTSIGPGLGGFVAFFVLAVLLYFLMRNMNARMRRMAYAERERVARLDAAYADGADDAAKANADSGADGHDGSDADVDADRGSGADPGEGDVPVITHSDEPGDRPKGTP